MQKGIFMELQELETFVTIVQQGSFSKAAEKTGYSQAAVTIHIKNLEKELNIRLFDRLGKKISLTGHGKIFYHHIIQALNSLTLARESLSSEAHLSGTICIGTIDSLCSSLFEQLITRFHERYPDVTVSIITDTIDGLIQKLNNNDIDFVYLADRKWNDSNWIKVLEEEENVVFISSPTHPLAGKEEISPDELFSYPFLLTEKNASYRQILDQTLAGMKLTISPFLESTNTDLLLKMIQKDAGISFLPEYVIKQALESESITVLQVPSLKTRIWRQLFYHKDKWVSREMNAFFELIQNQGTADMARRP